EINIERTSIGHSERPEILPALWETVGVTRKISQLRHGKSLSIGPALQIQLIDINNDRGIGRNSRCEPADDMWKDVRRWINKRNDIHVSIHVKAFVVGESG